MNTQERRGPWYLLTGLLIGIGLGLLYAWVLQPVEYINTAPQTLHPAYKDEYRLLIAVAYLGNPDPLRARARLALLGDADPFRALAEQAQRTLAQRGTDQEARALGLLALAIGQDSPGAIPLPKESYPTEVLSATIPPSPQSGETPTETSPISIETSMPGEDLPSPSNAPFVLLSREVVCDPPLPTPLFQIQALDRFNRPIPGVLVIVTWPGGEERFYTGLKAEKGLGYADFTPQVGVLYTVRLGENGQAVRDLAAAQCPAAGGAPLWGIWLLTFVQP